MCHTKTTREGRLLHNWFTSKHRLISVVSSSPSQAVSPESSVSEGLPRFTSTHVNGDMHTCKQDCDTMTKKTVIENRKTVNAQPASIIMNSASAAASPRRQGHQPTGHHAAHIHPERPPCWQCVQSNPKPCCQPCGFLLVILFPNPSFSCVNMHPLDCGGDNPDTKPKSRKQPNIRHLNPRQTMPAMHALIL